VPNATARELRRILGDSSVLAPVPLEYLQDASASRGLRGTAEAAVLPQSVEEVTRVVEWCCAHGVAMIPRGGGTGLCGGAVPSGGVVISTERLTRVRAFEPLLWRVEVEAGVRTQRLAELALGSGLFFPPNPGAAEQSQIGGNIATNVAGAHSLKYGTIRDWILGLEVVVPTYGLLTFGGPVRKDSSTYDLTSLFVGSEGTLGVITSAWFRLVPRPEARRFVIGVFHGAEDACAAIDRVRGSGLLLATLDYVDGSAVAVTARRFDWLSDAAFVLVAEVDGTEGEVGQIQDDVAGVIADSSGAAMFPDTPDEVAELQRWRDGLSLAVATHLGGKISEDVAVPVEHFATALDELRAIAAECGVPVCSWGHAGDGNIHASFLFEPDAEPQRMRAIEAADRFVDVVISLRGSTSAEHGVGSFKKAHVAKQLSEDVREIQRRLKSVFDPDSLMNPAKLVD
jgi:FAD/FMN-containing dehydrogenase